MMNRKQFINTLLLTGLGLKMGTLDIFKENTELMPVLFLGHGSPMNAIEDNEFVQGFKNLAKTLTKPKAILCISAHWETQGTFVTAVEKPKTIHDFGGFPKQLFDVQYPAPGSPTYALETQKLVKSLPVQLDYQWGLDHGAWSVLIHLFPNADIPVYQMSLNYLKKPSEHYQLAQELKELRKKGVLIVGSGNLVHNLSRVAWDKINGPEYGYDWAIEANTKMKKWIENNDIQSLVNYSNQGSALQLAIPSPDHFLPLLYALAVKNKDEEIQFINDKYVAGSLSMTSVVIK